MKRIGILSPTPPIPDIRGNRKRILEIIRFFKSSGYFVDFFYYPRECGYDYDSSVFEGNSAVVDRFQVIPPVHIRNNYPKGEHYGIDDWWDDGIERYLNWVQWSTKYDAFLVNYVFFSKAFECFPSSTLKILDTHDKMAGRKEMLMSNGMPPEFFYTTIQEERKALSRADLAIAITDKEAGYFEKITDTPVVTVGYADLYNQSDKPTLETEVKTGKRIKFGYFASENGINQRCLRLLVELLNKVNISDNFELVIAGLISDYAAKLNLSAFNVGIMGKINRPEDFYSQVDVVLCPYDFGTGLKIKVTEGLAFGKPILATKNAISGVPATHSYHKLNSIASMPDAIQEILSVKGKLKELMEATVQLHQENKSRVMNALENVKLFIEKRIITLEDHTSWYKGCDKPSKLQIQWLTDLINELVKKYRVRYVDSGFFTKHRQLVDQLGLKSSSWGKVAPPIGSKLLFDFRSNEVWGRLIADGGNIEATLSSGNRTEDDALVFPLRPINSNINDNIVIIYSSGLDEVCSRLSEAFSLTSYEHPNLRFVNVEEVGMHARLLHIIESARIIIGVGLSNPAVLNVEILSSVVKRPVLILHDFDTKTIYKAALEVLTNSMRERNNKAALFSDAVSYDIGKNKFMHNIVSMTDV